MGCPGAGKTRQIRGDEICGGVGCHPAATVRSSTPVDLGIAGRLLGVQHAIGFAGRHGVSKLRRAPGCRRAPDFSEGTP
jgi:hypothetical protein